MSPQWEEVGQAVDTLDNLLVAMTMPLPAHLHLEALKQSLPALRDVLKATFIEATGENPWTTNN